MSMVANISIQPWTNPARIQRDDTKRNLYILVFDYPLQQKQTVAYLSRVEK